ncbi:MAG: nucleotide-binding protein [Promethearchaeota archaeon]
MPAVDSDTGLKIGVVGKGGVGKTLFASTFARLAARTGRFHGILAIDNDPSLNLGMALGVPEDEIGPPISEMKDLIKERTGRAPGESGAFKLNPKVDDIPERFTVVAPDGVRLLVLGTIKDPGSGCLCSSNALVRELLYHLIVQRDELVILDFEAGMESSMGRATSKGLDVLIVMVEPGQKSIIVGSKITRMARKLGIKDVYAIINKVEDTEQESLIKDELNRRDMNVLGTIPVSKSVKIADIKGIPILDYDADDPAVRSIQQILDKVLSRYYK